MIATWLVPFLFSSPFSSTSTSFSLFSRITSTPASPFSYFLPFLSIGFIFLSISSLVLSSPFHFHFSPFPPLSHHPSIFYFTNELSLPFLPTPPLYPYPLPFTILSLLLYPLFCPLLYPTLLYPILYPIPYSTLPPSLPSTYR